MELQHFLSYMRSQQDDSPLYVFEGAFDDERRARGLLDMYTVPKYFQEDLLRFAGERRRPPYRWFLIGPKRSGTNVHVDPLGTSAWNTLVHGVKRCVSVPSAIACRTS